MDPHAANTILVVDDEASLRFFLSEELESRGYQVLLAGDGREALDLLKQRPVDLAIIDLQMPYLNGLELMAAMETLADAPELIMLTAYATLENSIEAMRHGSSDFLLKPYQVDQLLASIERALARRRRKVQQKQAVRLLVQSLGLSETLPEDTTDPPPAAKNNRIEEPTDPANSAQAAVHSPRISRRGLILDLEAMTVTKNDKPVNLTPTEFRLLATLMKRPDHPYSFQELAETIYSQPVDPFQARDLLKSSIGRLRQKLGAAPEGNTYIVNVYGLGYKFSGK